MSARNKLKEFIRQLIQKELAEASSTATAGNIHYKTPYAFKKKGKKGPSIYYYKLGFKPVPKITPKSFDVKELWEAEKLNELNNFQKERIAAFDDIEKRLNDLSESIDEIIFTDSFVFFLWKELDGVKELNNIIEELRNLKNF